MVICLIGDFSANMDEGYKNVCHYLAKELESHHIVIKLDVKKISSLNFWKTVINAHPHIAHLITQPTSVSLFVRYCC